jgi:hypothetical protein
MNRESKDGRVVWAHDIRDLRVDTQRPSEWPAFNWMIKTSPNLCRSQKKVYDLPSVLYKIYGLQYLTRNLAISGWFPESPFTIRLGSRVLSPLVVAVDHPALPIKPTNAITPTTGRKAGWLKIFRLHTHITYLINYIYIYIGTIHGNYSWLTMG